MAHIWNAAFKQGYFIAPPRMTEKNCPDVSGRVFLLTGGTEGIGYELCKILHGANGTVYLTSRTSSKAEAAAEKICAEYPHSKGRVEGLQLDLTDLKSVKACAEEFLKREQKLDVLFNNAGVQMLPLKGKTVQGHEIRMGANCLGHYLLTEELIQTLKATAALRREEGAPEGCVRILWAGSCTLDLSAPRGGVELDGDGAPKPQPSTGGNYGQSKAGNLFLAKPFREKLKQDGILMLQPGNVNDRHTVRRNFQCTDFQAKLLEWFFLHPIAKGAYTELWTGLSRDLTLQNDEFLYVAPWGQKSYNRWDVEREIEEGA